MTKQMVWQGKRYPLGEDNIVLMRNKGLLWANLPLYLEEVNHSPTGFEWGYLGSGPSQLSYAILRTYFEIAIGNTPQIAKTLAERFYFRFKEDNVAKWGTDEWKITSDEISDWIDECVWGKEK